jgi:hypothetical protein
MNPAQDMAARYVAVWNETNADARWAALAEECAIYAEAQCHATR